MTFRRSAILDYAIVLTLLIGQFGMAAMPCQHQMSDGASFTEAATPGHRPTGHGPERAPKHHDQHCCTCTSPCRTLLAEPHVTALVEQLPPQTPDRVTIAPRVLPTTAFDPTAPQPPVRAPPTIG